MFVAQNYRVLVAVTVLETLSVNKENLSTVTVHPVRCPTPLALLTLHRQNAGVMQLISTPRGHTAVARMLDMRATIRGCPERFDAVSAHEGLWG